LIGSRYHPRVAEFVLTRAQEIWAERKVRTHSEGRAYWRSLIALQRGRCAFSGAPLRFDAASSVGTRTSKGPHPLYASPAIIVHGPKRIVHAVVSTGLLNLLVRLPLEIAEEVRWLPTWKKLMTKWHAQAERAPGNRAAFHALAHPDPPAPHQLMK
jgi:hypothetical protein